LILSRPKASSRSGIGRATCTRRMEAAERAFHVHLRLTPPAPRCSVARAPYSRRS
jgi:hypothetical protein